MATSVPLALIAGLAIGVYSTSQTVSKDLQEALQAVEAARISDYIELRVSEISRQSRRYAMTIAKESLERYSNPKSFVNFLLPPLDKGRVGVG